MADVPIVGGDKNIWGTKLNTFLNVAHETSGANGGKVKHLASNLLLDDFLAVAHEVSGANGGKVKHLASNLLLDNFLAVAHETSGANAGKVRAADTIYVPLPGTVQSTVQTRLRKIVYISDFVDNNLNTAITAIGATKTTLYFDVVSTCTGPLTIPNTINIVIPIGSSIDIVSGTLTINASSSIGMYAAFTGSGNVVFGSGAVIEVYPDWFSGNDYGLQMNAAIASVKGIGGVKVKITKSAEVTTSINLTNVTTGLIIEGNGCSFTGSASNPVLKAKLTTILFDCTGSNNLVFRDFGIDTDTTTYPKCAFLFARNATGGGGGEHILSNVRVNYIAKFSVATVYSYASEVNNYYNCIFINTVPGAKVFYATGFNNIAPMSSVYQTIATGVQSNSVYNFFSCSFYSRGGVNSDIFYIDNAADIHIYGGFLYNSTGTQNGRAYIYVNSINGTSDIVSIHGVRAEPSASEYGVFFGNEAVSSPAFWSITECRLDCNINNVYASDNITLVALNYSEIADTLTATNYGVSVKNMRNSNIDMRGSGRFQSRVGGTIENCKIDGNFVDIELLGASTACTLNDIQYGAIWKTQDALGNGPAFPVTLTGGGATTTTWANKVVTANSIIVLFPTSSNAAAAVGSAGGVYISGKNAGVSFTITHPATEGATFNGLIFN